MLLVRSIKKCDISSLCSKGIHEQRACLVLLVMSDHNAMETTGGTTVAPCHYQMVGITYLENVPDNQVGELLLVSGGLQRSQVDRN